MINFSPTRSKRTDAFTTNLRTSLAESSHKVSIDVFLLGCTFMLLRVVTICKNEQYKQQEKQHFNHVTITTDLTYN